jgi:hypothetical protein
MHRPILDPIATFLFRLTDGCATIIFMMVGLHAADALGMDPGLAPPLPTPASAGGLSKTEIIQWIVIGGGGLWGIRQVGELVFAIRKGWITAAEGTNLQKLRDAEARIAVLEEGREKLNAELISAGQLLHAKDDLIRETMGQIKDYNALSREKDAEIARLNREARA